MNDILLLRERINKAQIQKEICGENIISLTKELDVLISDKQSIDESKEIIEKVATATQSKLRFYIKDIVQLALDSCFPGEFEFDVEFSIEYGKTAANLVFKHGGCEEDPIDACGGGVVDVAAFALRIAVWSMGRSANTIILDEPFRLLSRGLHKRAGEILKTLSEKLNIQMIMITHSSNIAEFSDLSYDVRKIDGVSECKVL